MNIIKQGKLPEENNQITCKKCDTVYEYSSKDLDGDWRDGSQWVRCPVCKEIKYTRASQPQTNRMDD